MTCNFILYRQAWCGFFGKPKNDYRFTHTHTETLKQGWDIYLKSYSIMRTGVFFWGSGAQHMCLCTQCACSLGFEVIWHVARLGLHSLEEQKLKLNLTRPCIDPAVHSNRCDITSTYSYYYYYCYY